MLTARAWVVPTLAADAAAAAQLRHLDLAAASGLHHALADAALAALARHLKRVSDAADAASPDAASTEGRSGGTGVADGAAALGLTLARLARRGPDGRWPASGLASPVATDACPAAVASFVVRGRGGWCANVSLVHLHAAPALVRFLRARARAYATRALPASGGAESALWRWVGALPPRVLSAAVRAAGGPTAAVQAGVALPECTFVMSADDRVGWQGDGILTLLVKASGDQGQGAGHAAARRGDLAAWAASTAALGPLLEAARGQAWGVLERAAADLASAEAWLRVVEGAEPWQAWCRNRDSSVGRDQQGTTTAGVADSSSSSSSSAAATGIDAAAFSTTRRELRIPLKALHAGLVRYRPSGLCEEEEREADDEEEEDEEVSELEHAHHSGGGGSSGARGVSSESGVAVASSSSGGLWGLLACCPALPLADIGRTARRAPAPALARLDPRRPRAQRGHCSTVERRVSFRGSRVCGGARGRTPRGVGDGA